ncbi:protein pygopus-like isoform X2 [Synchiropus splendidus]|uniref:protein pygopus-like isoform X2 n=1 Tax=Synchiropus splendidus TaxID=270530 RepID=UPI00237EA9E2|nr:protein pygopus-like isoform X2 [Synchiropus splendidus]
MLPQKLLMASVLVAMVTAAQTAPLDAEREEAETTEEAEPVEEEGQISEEEEGLHGVQKTTLAPVAPPSRVSVQLDSSGPQETGAGLEAGGRVVASASSTGHSEGSSLAMETFGQDGLSGPPGAGSGVSQESGGSVGSAVAGSLPGQQSSVEPGASSGDPASAAGFAGHESPDASGGHPPGSPQGPSSGGLIGSGGVEDSEGPASGMSGNGVKLLNGGGAHGVSGHQGVLVGSVTQQDLLTNPDLQNVTPDPHHHAEVQNFTSEVLREADLHHVTPGLNLYQDLHNVTPDLSNGIASPDVQHESPELRRDPQNVTPDVRRDVQRITPGPSDPTHTVGPDAMVTDAAFVDPTGTSLYNSGTTGWDPTRTAGPVTEQYNPSGSGPEGSENVELEDSC